MNNRRRLDSLGTLFWASRWSRGDRESVISIVGRLNESSQLKILSSNPFRVRWRWPNEALFRPLFPIFLLVCALTSQSVLAQDPPAKPTDPKTAAAQNSTTTAKPEPSKPVDLLEETKFNTTWKYFSADSKTSLGDTWTLKKDEDGSQMLVCGGKPFGYLKTAKSYENYEFGFEWRYANGPNGNSGVLIHTGSEDKIWPKAVQIQLHRPTAGSIFPSGGATTDNTLAVKDLNLETGKWHECVVTSRMGTVAVSIDGKKLGGISGCNPRSGPIALQSEGSEIHFRKVWVRNLTEDEMKTDDSNAVQP